MASGLLILLDDLAALLDDIATMSKVATKKAAGIVGDDLAVSANQVTGSASASERELPIVWAVTKGSMINKVIIVPVAILISLFAPWLIPYLLLGGGLFLCYEGSEKIIHTLQHKNGKTEDQTHLVEMDPMNLMDFEKQKIKEAIRTDFVLSIEIVLISLGALTSFPIWKQAIVLSLVAFAITIAVYGVVALIVRIDDVGSFLVKKKDVFFRSMGEALLWFAPRILRSLAFIGTAAMLLVGGELLLHFMHDKAHIELLSNEPFGMTGFGVFVLNSILTIAFGLLSGFVVVLGHHLIEKVKK